MQTLKFKTTVKCEGCINAITPYMRAIEGIESWKVDLSSPDKILEVTVLNGETKNISDAVISGLKEAGYFAQLI